MKMETMNENRDPKTEIGLHWDQRPQMWAHVVVVENLASIEHTRAHKLYSRIDDKRMSAKMCPY